MIRVITSSDKTIIFLFIHKTLYVKSPRIHLQTGRPQKCLVRLDVPTGIYIIIQANDNIIYTAPRGVNERENRQKKSTYKTNRRHT